MQYSVVVRNAQLDAFEETVGEFPILKIFTGTEPANCAAADSGTVLATVALPADWMIDASNGLKTKLGTWEDAGADANGTAGHFRLYASDGTTCHQQGTVTLTGGGGDMTVDNLSFALGQPFTITSYSIARGNA